MKEDDTLMMDGGRQTLKTTDEEKQSKLAYTTFQLERGGQRVCICVISTQIMLVLVPPQHDSLEVHCIFSINNLLNQ